MVTVVIDPGHGGPSNPPKVGGSRWNNAVGPNGTLEKDLTLKVAKAAQKAFKQRAVQVVMTRETDVNLGIVARAKKAKRLRADAFVSIHFNAAEKDKPPAQGTETWIESRPTKRSRQLARRLQAAVVAVTNYRDRGIKLGNVSGVIRNKHHRRRTAHCLVEISFIDRQPLDEQRLTDPNYIKDLGNAVCDGTMDYLEERGLITDESLIASAEFAREPDDAASAAAMGLLDDDGLFRFDASLSMREPEQPSLSQSAQKTENLTSLNLESVTPAQRLAMAQAIVNFEARRDSRGRLKVYYLPRGDGGGRYEVAGINERFHKAVCDRLVELIENGRQSRAEQLAVEYIASYTDTVVSWCSNPAIASYLRDCVFNRGPGGAAWILQTSVGVTVDGVVGPRTRQAVSDAERDPRVLLSHLRDAREKYERQVKGRNERNRFWRGLVNRWNKALRIAIGFLGEDLRSLTSTAAADPVLSDVMSEYADDANADGEITDNENLLCDRIDEDVPLAMATAPEKPEVINKYTTKHHYSRSGHDISQIIIHYTTSNNYMSAVRTFEKPYWSRRRRKWIKTSAHYIVGRKGELVQMVDDDKAAWHAGDEQTNYKSIGIEHAAAPGKNLTQDQNNKTIELIRWLMHAYDIPAENIIAHKCVRDTNCPGDIFEDYGATKDSKCKKVNKAIQRWLSENGIS